MQYPIPFSIAFFVWCARWLRLARIRWCSVVAALCATVLITGCTTPRNVESTVQSYSTITALPKQSTFRIEQLPSQQADTQFTAIARMVCTELQHVGLRPDSDQAALVVTIHTQAGYTAAQWPYDAYPWSAGGFGWHGGFYRHRGGISARTLLRDDPPRLYRRGLAILMRDTQSQKVIYETSAVHEDVWTQDPDIYRTLARAALQGFPNPPTNTRQVLLPLHAATDDAAPAQPAAPNTPQPLTQPPRHTSPLAAGC